MIFSSTIFLFVFLPLVLIGYFFIKENYQNGFLLLVSLCFYAWGEPKFVLILIVAIIINYSLALLIDLWRKKYLLIKLIVAIMLALNLSLLFVYKYLATSIKYIDIFGYSGNLLLFNLALPLGISFFTLHLISYVLDVYFQSSKTDKNIINVGLYVTFFPKILMGPITRYSEISNQIKSSRTVSLDRVTLGVKRFIIGLIKAVVISVPLGIISDNAFSVQTNDLSILLAWLGIISFCLQLYFFFSGYSDMAIGLGKMFGFDLPENVNYPYMSKSISEYWNRWHITLGEWFRVYVNNPVAAKLNKSITRRIVSAESCNIIVLLLIWLLIGIWHGSGWKFVVFGLWWFLFISIERFMKVRRKNSKTRVYTISAHIYTLAVVMIGQLLFRAPSLPASFSYLRSMFGLTGNVLYDGLSLSLFRDNGVILALAILFSLPTVKFVKRIVDTYALPNKIGKLMAPIIYILLFIIGISYIVNGSYNPFAYPIF